MVKKKSNLELILEQGLRIHSKSKKDKYLFLRKNYVEIVYDKKTEKIMSVYKLK